MTWGSENMAIHGVHCWFRGTPSYFFLSEMQIITHPFQVPVLWIERKWGENRCPRKEAPNGDSAGGFQMGKRKEESE